MKPEKSPRVIKVQLKIKMAKSNNNKNAFLT